mmetsp:Transcript_67978/g.160009  ORF Transcript_67978/g.160009 Transcript_67978/m.160009 type:complete len:280 (-) Transcript_67978:89-928(-)
MRGPTKLVHIRTRCRAPPCQNLRVRSSNNLRIAWHALAGRALLLRLLGAGGAVRLARLRGLACCGRPPARLVRYVLAGLIGALGPFFLRRVGILRIAARLLEVCTGRLVPILLALQRPSVDDQQLAALVLLLLLPWVREDGGLKGFACRASCVGVPAQQCSHELHDPHSLQLDAQVACQGILLCCAACEGLLAGRDDDPLEVTGGAMVGVGGWGRVETALHLQPALVGGNAALQLPCQVHEPRRLILHLDDLPRKLRLRLLGLPYRELPNQDHINKHPE